MLTATFIVKAHSICCISVLNWNGTLAWWNQGELICKADLAVLWSSVQREGKGAAQQDSKHLSAKIRTNEIQFTWLEGKERSVIDRMLEWKQPVAAPPPPPHGYQRMRQPTRFVLSPAPSHQIRVAAWGTGTVCVRVPWGNDTEYKCTGSARDGPAHVEVFALQRRAVSTACSGSQCQGDRWRWRLLSSAPQNIRTLDIAELAPAGSSTSTQLTFLYVWILQVYL